MGTLEIRSVGTPDNLYSLSYRDHEAGEGAKRDPVAGVDLRRVEPGRQRKDTRTARQVPRRADQALRAKLEEAEAASRISSCKYMGVAARATPTTSAGSRRLSEADRIGASSSCARPNSRATRTSANCARMKRRCCPARGARSATAAVATPEFDARLRRRKRQLDALAAAIHGPAPRRRSARVG